MGIKKLWYPEIACLIPIWFCLKIVVPVVPQIRWFTMMLTTEIRQNVVYPPSTPYMYPISVTPPYVPLQQKQSCHFIWVRLKYLKMGGTPQECSSHEEIDD